MTMTRKDFDAIADMMIELRDDIELHYIDNGSFKIAHQVITNLDSRIKSICKQSNRYFDVTRFNNYVARGLEKKRLFLETNRIKKHEAATAMLSNPKNWLQPK